MRGTWSFGLPNRCTLCAISHPSMTTNIVGTINPDHLKENLAAVAKGELSADVYDEAKRRLTAAGTAPQA